MPNAFLKLRNKDVYRNFIPDVYSEIKKGVLKATFRKAEFLRKKNIFYSQNRPYKNND